MQAGRGWEEVRRVAVAQQSSGAQGKRSTAAVQRGGGRHRLRVRLKHGGLLGLLVLAGHFPVAGLDAFFLHGEGPVDLEGGVGLVNLVCLFVCFLDLLPCGSLGTLGLTLCSLK